MAYSQQCISYTTISFWPKKEEKPALWQIFHGLVCMVRRFTLQCHQPNKLLNPHRPMKNEVQQVLRVKTLQYPKPALRGTLVGHLDVLKQPPRVSEIKAKRVMKSQQRLEAFSKKFEASNLG